MVMQSYAHANPFAVAPCTKPSAVASFFEHVAAETIVADSNFKT
jgi:hypothetical protein